jgi:hypothetical protein
VHGVACDVGRRNGLGGRVYVLWERVVVVILSREEAA